jgi:ribulose-5-phosphate 4-epimerase/fuculose-1-phosphate aldolase
MTTGTIENTLRELVLANRILAREGVIDDFGHVSVRSPADPNRYFLSRSRSPEIVDLADIMEFTLEGDAIDGQGRRPYAERALHGAIYMARADVNAVTHHHARSVLPFTVTDIPLKPLFHMASVIGHEVPLWDSQPEFGDTNMLVDDLPKGHSLAKALGKNPTALLRGHGAVCVGANLREAVFVSIYMKENAELVLASRKLGELKYLTQGEIDQTSEMLRSPLAQNRTWDYRIARAGFRGL